MKWITAAGVTLIVGVIAAVGYYWLRTPEFDRCYRQVVWGMTLARVREVMGREEDSPDERQTTTGEFERSWTFDDGARITVVFDPDGRSKYKEIAPDFCGVTPLMGKYFRE